MSDPHPMRVAQVVRPAEGGMRRQVTLLVGGLDRALFSSTLYAPKDFTLENAGCDIVHVPIDISAKSSMVRDIRAIRALSTALDRQIDMVHAHGLRAAFIGVLAARRAHIPVLFTAHNLPPALNAIQRAVLLFVSRRSDAVISVSDAVSAELQAYGIETSRIYVISNGIPLEDYLNVRNIELGKLAINSTGRILLFVGRLSHEKGLDTLLDAFTTITIRRPDVRLLVAGAGPDEPRLRNRAANMTTVHFLGLRSDVPELLNRADIVVVPSYSEGQGLVAIEAMASGKPLVASNVGGLAEVIVNGETGILIPPKNSGALADAILTLLADPGRATAMGTAGKLRAQANYSVAQMIDSVQKLYLSIVHQDGT